MTWYLAVSRKAVDINRQEGRSDPPVVYGEGRDWVPDEGERAFEVALPAGSTVVYDPVNPLKNGATLFIVCPVKPRRIR